MSAAKQTAPQRVSPQEALLDLPRERLAAVIESAGLPAYRAGQLYDWLHLRNAAGPEQMTDLPAELRTELATRFRTWPMRLARKVVSHDGSVKYGWLTSDGNPVEAVLMPGFDYGTALCVSSQSGCGMACRFCQTGYMGLRQYLSAGEILQQVYEAEADWSADVPDANAQADSNLPRRRLAGARPPRADAKQSTRRQLIDRVVFMGMGEPLLNLRAVRRVIDVLCGKPRGWSPRRITVSTVGLTAPMLLMARSFPRVNLALSLHFTTAAGRRQHMPDTESDPRKLAEALYFYRQVNGGKVTIEYTLMRGVNDAEADAQRLVKFARLSGITTTPSELTAEALEHEPPPNQQPLPLHVNLIAYNPIASANYEATPERGINAFARILRDAGVPVTVRHSRGRDVAAACGMLGTEMAASR